MAETRIDSAELQQLRSEVQELRQREAEAKARETEFLSELSHKLRTPITSIKSFSEILLRYPNETPEQKTEFVKIIADETQRLLELLNQTLDARRGKTEPITGIKASNKTVLIVDDEEKILKSFSFYLEKQGYQTLTANSVTEAQDVLQHARPGSIFLDIFLPDGNGYDYCEKLKAAQPERPVILMSAQKQDKDRLRAMTVKADGFIAKPFAFEEVLATLHNLTV